MVLPPLCPLIIIEGIGRFEMASFDSAAPTYPTGVAIIRAGLAFPLFTARANSNAAVGAFPIRKIAPSKPLHC